MIIDRFLLIKKNVLLILKALMGSLKVLLFIFFGFPVRIWMNSTNRLAELAEDQAWKLSTRETEYTLSRIYYFVMDLLILLTFPAGVLIILWFILMMISGEIEFDRGILNILETACAAYAAPLVFQIFREFLLLPFSMAINIEKLTRNPNFKESFNEPNKSQSEDINAGKEKKRAQNRSTDGSTTEENEVHEDHKELTVTLQDIVTAIKDCQKTILPSSMKIGYLKALLDKVGKDRESLIKLLGDYRIETGISLIEDILKTSKDMSVVKYLLNDFFENDLIEKDWPHKLKISL
ncbi:MAG: hypothetical protein IH591_14845 [Bacteroidales bacterium]|nr:hypothetical protein [Bacteroidales bacterium]